MSKIVLMIINEARNNKIVLTICKTGVKGLATPGSYNSLNNKLKASIAITELMSGISTTCQSNTQHDFNPLHSCA